LPDGDESDGIALAALAVQSRRHNAIGMWGNRNGKPQCGADLHGGRNNYRPGSQLLQRCPVTRAVRRACQGDGMHANPWSGEREAPASQVPVLFVDLDGTLIKGDLLVESVLALLRHSPSTALRLPIWLLRGRAALKAEVAKRVQISLERLPINADLVEYLHNERKHGRRIYLATASDRSLACEVAQHFGLFEGVLASDGRRNLKGERKLEAIREVVGTAPFDYAGNDRADLRVWRHARHALVVNAPRRVASRAAGLCPVERVFGERRARARTWLRAMRVHQWAKNLLLAVPALTAHALGWHTAGIVLAAFVAFSLAASSVYLLNDLLDLEDDRHHPRKRTRPFASGELPLAHGLLGTVVLLAVSVAIAAGLSHSFLLALLAYLALTSAYSIVLKHYMLLDVLLLASLYTIRIFAGAAAIAVPVSSWLLAFSMFAFLSLALVKRTSELVTLRQLSRTAASGRDYRVSDLQVLTSMGVAAGYAAVLVLALFVSAPDVAARYGHPQVLWLLCPLLLYWLSRLWMKTLRGEMHDDPLVFAFRDRASRVIGAVMVTVTLAAF
jgi:4-hydroxybenzoate polyprenyltransferase